MIKLIKCLYLHFVDVKDPARLTAVRVVFTLLLLLLWSVELFS